MLLQLLLSNQSIDINAKDNSGINAMYVATYYGHLEALALLENQGAKFDKTFKGTTLLHVAAKRGYLDVIKHLVYKAKAKNQSIDVKKLNGMTPVMIAAKHNQFQVFRYLHLEGANLKAALDTSENIMYLAA